MDGETASWIFYSGLLMYGLVLFAFKRLYLDTLESSGWLSFREICYTDKK